MTPVARPLPTGAARLAAVGVLGVLLGFSLSRIGFTDYDELHRMFVFADLRMFFVFAGGVVATGLGLVALRRHRDLGRRAVSKRVVVGGVLFGLGWAVAGACPGVAFAQIGEGKLFAVVTVAGMFAGAALARRVLKRRALAQAGDAC